MEYDRYNSVVYIYLFYFYFNREIYGIRYSFYQAFIIKSIVKIKIYFIKIRMYFFSNGDNSVVMVITVLLW